MRGYVEQLIKLDINIEDIIKWFFETYLLQEFDIKDYTCSMPNSADSILSKCKTLASAIDALMEPAVLQHLYLCLLHLMTVILPVSYQDEPVLSLPPSFHQLP